MHAADGELQLSASDLVNHLACRHLTALNLAVTAGERKAPFRRDRMLELLVERGLAHERSYIEHLEAAGLQVTRIDGAGIQAGPVDDTVAAMRAGAEVIVQGALTDGRWSGRADILRRVDAPSGLGPWSYEVYDTKLSRETKGGTILQLSLYSDLAASVQGRPPEHMYVVPPWSGFQAQRFRIDDYAAYYRLVRRDLEGSLAQDAQACTYPDPKPHCDVCRWRHDCEARRRDDDHLCLVAGISGTQTRELQSRGIGSTAALAVETLPLGWKPERGAAQSYQRVREQARVQVEARKQQRPFYETLPLEPERGLARLPGPSPGDVFFDFEGDSFAGEGGLEYLFGYVYDDDAGEQQYTGLWALDREAERANFQQFVDWVMERWRRHPDMHVYHFAPYEPSAMKRLMGRYATREDEVDRMLRAGLFVDLYRVVRDGILAGVESYSIKKLEAFYEYERFVDLDDANDSLYKVESALELADAPGITEEDKRDVEGYNRDDCISTLRLRDWLEGIRTGLTDGGEQIERPASKDGDPSEPLNERRQRFQALAEHIAQGVPADRDERSEEQHARWVLANVLDWHWREDKVDYWEHYRLSVLSVEDLADERQAVANLAFLERVGGTDRAPIHRYRYEDQETDLRGGASLRNDGGSPLGTLVDIDLQARTVDIKKRQDTAEVHPEAAYAFDRYPTDGLADSLLRLGEHVAGNGIGGSGAYGAARDLLLRRPPRLGGHPIRAAGETGLAAALRIGPWLQSTVLPIQGPPGSGKTYTGGRMIADLVHRGKRVGITANSHKVIRNLMDEVIEAVDERGIAIKAIQRCQPEDFVVGQGRIALAEDNPAVSNALDNGTQLVGGSAWLWTTPEAAGAVDVLFVDEAAQMSLANVLAVSQAADSLVLLGDPQQLEQPTKGSHPDGAGVSALAHLLDGRQTIEEDRGLFLEETRRLHPDVCEFTSEVFYQDKLSPHQGMEQQRVISDGPVSGTGLRLLSVTHEGNRNSSSEEADRVAELYRRLTDGGSAWVDDKGETRPITNDDVLIIAPYNAQVAKLLDRMPGARIGSVDRFQGQEAPVVIYSMATSTPEEAPRGMEFLFSLNRLNVATSRARCVCVLVASPALFAPECRTPRQMQLANAFCRYKELATEVVL